MSGVIKFSSGSVYAGVSVYVPEQQRSDRFTQKSH